MFGFELNLDAERGPVTGERARRRRLDDGGQRGAANDRAARQRRELPRDVTGMARESGIATPTADDLARFDRKRSGMTLANADGRTGRVRPTRTPRSPR